MCSVVSTTLLAAPTTFADASTSVDAPLASVRV
jgi:hypothetical protein